MTAAQTIVLLWLLTALAAVAGLLLHVIRQRARRLLVALCALPGAVLAYGGVVLAAGITEAGWGAFSAGSLLAGAAGVAGAGLVAMVWWSALRPVRRPGECPACGYALGGLPRCPECGR